jgi:glycosyltransferase involved in cell wall biosynthesis
VSTRFGFVSTFPPTQCGLATFTASLRNALLDGTPRESVADEGWVVRLMEEPESRSVDGDDGRDGSVTQLVMKDPASLRRAAQRLNQCTAVILQHEYGVYGGPDGDEVLALLDQIDVPCVVVLHTVLVEPTTNQRRILQAVAAKADAVVTMTKTAFDRLASGYTVDMNRVEIIAHGAPDLRPTGTAFEPGSGRQTILSWGLLGPGKGIEWAIDAMSLLGDLDPAPTYVIAGQTHPKVLLHEGESYREGLLAQVHRLGLGDRVVFDDRYRSAEQLAALIDEADIVLLPYDSTDQVTSGVLIEAVAAAKPVVATRFPHARELLDAGAGLTVAHRDPVAIARALRSVMTEGNLAATMASVAAAAAPGLLWPAIADQYRTLVSRLITASIAA